jgi:dTMP kinase
MILNGDADRWSPMTELLLFNAARRDHLEKTVWPAIERGAIVLSDRYVDTSRVFQGLARAPLRHIVDQLHELMIGYEAETTFVFDIDPAIALKRGLARTGAESRFEDMGLQFQKDAHRGFANLINEFPDRIVMVDAEGTPEIVSERIRRAFDDRYPQFTRDGLGMAR